MDGRPDQRYLGLIDIDVRRNAYGRQVASFEAPVGLCAARTCRCTGVFIRAPRIERIGDGVEVRRGARRPRRSPRARARCWSTAFHPELTADRRLHRRFADDGRRAGGRWRHERALQVVDDQAQEGRRGQASRGKLFTKLSRAIIVAAKEGGPDPDANATLAAAIAKARSYSMPKDNIERAIARATGGGEGSDAYEAIIYEGYGPEGVAIIVEALTDNRNRTAADVRAVFTQAQLEPGHAGVGGLAVRAQGRDPGAGRRGRPRTTSCWRPPTPAPRMRARRRAGRSRPPTDLGPSATRSRRPASVESAELRWSREHRGLDEDAPASCCG